MLTDPDKYAPVFIEAGADMVSVHQEVCPHLDSTLRMIQSEGALAGVVLNPSTPVATLDEVLDIADYVLLMSVNPGFGGQTFLPNTLKKARQLDSIRRQRGLNFQVEIDGGVNLDNLVEILRAGVDWVVAGATIFRSPDPAETVRKMKELARTAAALSA
jgi:ribulose-phosphate 3-epimerase